jgi:hypothetical protein
MVDSLGMELDSKGMPGDRSGSLGTGMIVVFATLEELRVWGPIALREWLKRNRPPGRRLCCTGQVLEFAPGGHQTAIASEGAP